MPPYLLVGVAWPAPPALAREVKVVPLPLPDRAEVDAFLAGEVERYAAVPDIAQPALTAAEREPLTQALLGLTLAEIDNLIARAVVTNRRLDAAALPLFLREKRGETPAALRERIAGALAEPAPSDPSRPPALWELFATVPGLRDQERCIEAGMDRYLAKPILEEDLLAAIREAVQRYPAACNSNSSA